MDVTLRRKGRGLMSDFRETWIVKGRGARGDRKSRISLGLTTYSAYGLTYKIHTAYMYMRI